MSLTRECFLEMLLEATPVFRREPTSEEIEEANKNIQLHESVVVSLQRQIRDLQAQISLLQGVQAQHLRLVSQHRGVTTLARRIPPELLAKIFEHCVQEGWTRAPIVASHVCSQWREATKSYPRVWSTIYVDADSTDAIGRTRFWLSRAAKAPLAVIIVATWRAAPLHLMSIMDLLLRHADQWSTLTLDIPTLRQVQLVVSLCSHASLVFPLLGELSITTDVQFQEEIDGEADPIDFQAAFDMQRAPNLIKFSLNANVLPSNIIYPLTIRSLCLQLSDSPAQRPLGASSLINLLRPFPTLIRLTLSMPLLYDSPFVPEQDSEQVVILETLDTLTLYGPTNLNNLLAHLRAPSLRELHLRSLEDVGYRQEPIGPSLLSFIQSSEHISTTLESLELHDIDLSPNLFHLCFTSLQNLRELRLHESSISNKTLGYLNADPEGGLCPNLTKLDLRWCGHLQGTALVDLVRSRGMNINTDIRYCFDNDASSIASNTDSDQRRFAPITHVTVINCCFVEEQDVFNLARLTSCKVITRDGDYCCELPPHLFFFAYSHLCKLPAGAALTCVTDKGCISGC